MTRAAVRSMHCRGDHGRCKRPCEVYGLCHTHRIVANNGGDPVTYTIRDQRNSRTAVLQSLRRDARSMLEGHDVEALAAEPGWAARANCRDEDPATFFSAAADAIERAQAFCQPCPVKLHCLATAVVERHRFGTWGGAAFELVGAAG